MLNFLHEREGKTTFVYYVLKMSVFVQKETGNSLRENDSSNIIV